MSNLGLIRRRCYPAERARSEPTGFCLAGDPSCTVARQRSTSRVCRRPSRRQGWKPVRMTAHGKQVLGDTTLHCLRYVALTLRSLEFSKVRTEVTAPSRCTTRHAGRSGEPTEQLSCRDACMRRVNSSTFTSFIQEVSFLLHKLFHFYFIGRLPNGFSVSRARFRDRDLTGTGQPNQGNRFHNGNKIEWFRTRTHASWRSGRSSATK